jgi:hypothetical protein
MSSHTASVHVAGSTRKPFRSCATFVWNRACDSPVPASNGLFYAEGDLAAFLEDCRCKSERDFCSSGQS